MKKYIPLHVHSHYSLLDGLSKPTQIANRCEQIGVSSCALTDHGSISGSVQFHKEIKSKGIKPILGCEIYISELDSNIKTKENNNLSHFIVLAKNKNGWKKLIKLISETNSIDNFYHKPRISFDKLAQFAGNDMIGFCGHLGSTIANIIQNNPSDFKNKCINFISQAKTIFGEDNFS